MTALLRRLRALLFVDARASQDARSEPVRAGPGRVYARRPARLRGHRWSGGRRGGDALHALTVHAARAEQRERDRLAFVLHDDVQQVLAAARLHISFGAGDAEAVALIDQALRATRTLAHEIAPYGRDETFGRAVAQACQTFNARHHVDVRFMGDADADADETVAVVALSALRELLFNASRHAPGARVHVRVDAGVAWTRVRVVDEGPGFDPEQLSHSYGLRALRRRLEAVGGHIDAWSGAEGSRLTLCVPRPSR